MLFLKGIYFLDDIDGVLYSTDDYSVYYWYNMVFYDFDPHIAKDNARYHPIVGKPPDWNVITHKGKVLAKKVDGKYKEAE